MRHSEYPMPERRHHQRQSPHEPEGQQGIIPGTEQVHAQPLQETPRHLGRWQYWRRRLGRHGHLVFRAKRRFSMFNTQEVNRLILRYVTMIITTKGIACPVWLLMVKPILKIG